mgnify:CR=1 FL=1
MFSGATFIPVWVMYLAGVLGMGGMAIVYLLAPALDNIIMKIKLKVLIPVCLVLVCAFITDQIYSSSHPNEGKGITNYRDKAAVVEEIAAEAFDKS